MSEQNMIAIDVALVKQLISRQFPQWADLTIRPVKFSGWDNRTFHLGERMTVRLPSAAAYSLQVEKEQRWLPRLASHLPVAVPAPIAMGAPGQGYPWHWSVYRWIDGEPATIARIADLQEFAISLARFLNTLRHIDATDGPLPGKHNFFRGGPLHVYDGETREAIAALKSRMDADAAIAMWEAASSASWSGPAVWFHGDVSAGNLLVHHGRLSAVIDFGTCGVGDPACDLSIAWTLFEERGREAFCGRIQADAAMWKRGRGWTLWKALIVCAQLPGTTADPNEIQRSWRVLDEVLHDQS
ncbi:MAG: aminoglycoside phosphotransferase family protein [Acidobacteriaceae bacterium]